MANRSTRACVELVERALRCRAVETYGSAEFPRLGVACESGAIHCDDPRFLVVVIARDPDGGGDVVVTSLFPRVMPLVRHAPGDRAVVSECRCGRGVRRCAPSTAAATTS